MALAPIEKKTAEGLRPIVVSLAERKRRTIELGASYGTSEGLGLDARWTHYNVLARADTMALVGQAFQHRQPPGRRSHLAALAAAAADPEGSAAVYRNQTDAYDETGVGVSGRRHAQRTARPPMSPWAPRWTSAAPTN